MALTQTATTSFSLELLQALHNFGPTTPDTFKIALYGAGASLGADTTAYTTSGEVVASGYTAGGATLTITLVDSSNGVAFVSFSDVTWSAALTARGALIYNSTQGNRSVCVLDFGADKTSTTTFTVTMPAATYTSALLRVSKSEV